MKIRRLNGFSLMEMMVVLLIIAIVLAATTPMVSRRMARVSEGGSGESLWEEGLNNIIYPIDNKKVLIGSDSVSEPKGELHIVSKGYQIALSTDDTLPDTMTIFSHNHSFMFTNSFGSNETTPEDSVLIGHNADADESGKRKNIVVIGPSAMTYGDDTVAIGEKAITYGPDSVAIGHGTETGKNYYSTAIGYGSMAKNDSSIAIGCKAIIDAKKSKGGSIAIGIDTSIDGDETEDAIAIGRGAYVSKKNAVAIGQGAKATNEGDFVLGTTDNTVIIPGNLIVRGNVDLGTNKDSKVSLNAENKPDGETYDHRQVYYETGDSSLYFSDRKLKDVGEAFKGGLEELKKLDLYHFTFKKDSKKIPHVGVMAQDLQKIFPDAVIQGEDGFLKIRMEDMFYAVINAVKELDARLTKLSEQVKSNLDLITALQEKINAQEQEISELKNQNAEFEKRLAKLEKKSKKD